MESVKFANLCESDLAYLFGKSEKMIQQWISAGLPRNADGSYMLSKVCRWREKYHADRAREKVLLSKITQRELIALTGKSRQMISNWTKTENLPRNRDGSYDLAAFIQWLEKYFDRIHRQKYKKVARSVRKLFEIFKETEK